MASNLDPIVSLMAQCDFLDYDTSGHLHPFHASTASTVQQRSRFFLNYAEDDKNLLLPPSIEINIPCQQKFHFLRNEKDEFYLSRLRDLAMKKFNSSFGVEPIISSSVSDSLSSDRRYDDTGMFKTNKRIQGELVSHTNSATVHQSAVFWSSDDIRRVCASLVIHLMIPGRSQYAQLRLELHSITSTEWTVFFPYKAFSSTILPTLISLKNDPTLSLICVQQNSSLINLPWSLMSIDSVFFSKVSQDTSWRSSTDLLFHTSQRLFFPSEKMLPHSVSSSLSNSSGNDESKVSSSPNSSLPPRRVLWRFISSIAHRLWCETLITYFQFQLNSTENSHYSIVNLEIQNCLSSEKCTVHKGTSGIEDMAYKYLQSHIIHCWIKPSGNDILNPFANDILQTSAQKHVDNQSKGEMIFSIYIADCNPNIFLFSHNQSDDSLAECSCEFSKSSSFENFGRKGKVIFFGEIIDQLRFGTLLL